MKRCSISGLEITAAPQWVHIHPSGNSSTSLQRIGQDIFHLSAEADKSIILDVFEGDLLLKAVRESRLEGKPFYVIWNLEKVKGLSYRYKKGIAELILNKQPPLTYTIFYHIDPEFLPIAESIQAMLPEHMKLLFADSYAEAVRTILDIKAGNFQALEEQPDDAKEKRMQFLGAAARIGWLNMLTQPIILPPAQDRLYPFFKALDCLQQDLTEAMAHQKKSTEQFTREQALMLQSKQKQIEQQEQRKQALLSEFESIKKSLTDQIQEHEKEIDRATSNFHEQRGKIRDLCTLINHSNIDQATKKILIHTSNTLIETELNEKKIELPLTSTDSAFLSILQRMHPDLNKRELKICLMIKLSYDTDDIARSIGISKRGMESIRYRMHKKIGLKKHQSIKNYLSELSGNQHQRTQL